MGFILSVRLLVANLFYFTPKKMSGLSWGENQKKDRILVDKSSTLSWSYYLSDTKWEKRMEAFLPNQNQVENGIKLQKLFFNMFWGWENIEKYKMDILEFVL